MLILIFLYQSATVSPAGAPLSVANHVGYLRLVSAMVYAYAPTQVVVRLDAAISGGTATLGDFAVTVGGSTVSISVAQQSNALGLVTLTVPAVLTGEAVIVEYTKNSGSAGQNIASAAGSMDSQSAAVAPAASGVPLSVVNHVGYLYLASAMVYAYAPTQVVVRLDAAISGGTADLGDFVIQVGGSSAVISTIAQSNNLVTLTVPAISASTVVNVAYTKNAGNAGQNIASGGGVMDSQVSRTAMYACHTRCDSRIPAFRTDI